MSVLVVVGGHDGKPSESRERDVLVLRSSLSEDGKRVDWVCRSAGRAPVGLSYAVSFALKETDNTDEKSNDMRHLVVAAGFDETSSSGRWYLCALQLSDPDKPKMTWSELRSRLHHSSSTRDIQSKEPVFSGVPRIGACGAAASLMTESCPLKSDRHRHWKCVLVGGVSYVALQYGPPSLKLPEDTRDLLRSWFTQAPGCQCNSFSCFPFSMPAERVSRVVRRWAALRGVSMRKDMIPLFLRHRRPDRTQEQGTLPVVVGQKRSRDGTHERSLPATEGEHGASAREKKRCAGSDGRVTTVVSPGSVKVPKPSVGPCLYHKCRDVVEVCSDSMRVIDYGVRSSLGRDSPGSMWCGAAACLGGGAVVAAGGLHAVQYSPSHSDIKGAVPPAGIDGAWSLSQGGDSCVPIAPTRLPLPVVRYCMAVTHASDGHVHVWVTGGYSCCVKKQRIQKTVNSDVWVWCSQPSHCFRDRVTEHKNTGSSWVSVQRMPQPCYGAGSAVCRNGGDECLVVIGGKAKGGLLNCVQTLNMRSLRWSVSRDALPVAVSAPAVSAV